MSLYVGQLRKWHAELYMPFVVTEINDAVTHIAYTKSSDTDIFMTDDIAKFTDPYVDFEEELNEL